MKMQTKRLITLAKHLRAIENKVPDPNARGAKARGFSLRGWVSRGGAVDFKGRPCGIAACAFGEATFMPEFRKLGLGRSRSGIPVFKDRDACGAAALFFGITYHDAALLFDPIYYADKPISPAHVADKIGQLITRP